MADRAVAGEIIVSEQALAEAGMDGSKLKSRRLELKGISEPVPVRVMHGREEQINGQDCCIQ